MVGGGHVYVHELATGLSRRGHAVRGVYTGAPSALAREWEYPVTWVHHFARHQLNAVSVARWVVPRLHAFDVVHCHGLEGALVAEGLGRATPLVYTEHSSHLPSFRGSGIASVRSLGQLRAYYERVFFLPMRSLALRARRVVVLSRFNASRVIDGYGVDADRTRVIPSGLEVERFFPSEKPEAPDGAVSFGFVGRHDRFKGVDTLLRAFARTVGEVPASRLTVVGGGPLEEAHRRLADELGLRGHVELTGPLPRSATAERMRSFDVLVVPSRMESFGIVLLEGMATRLAVVATRVGGIPEIVEDGLTGLLVPPDDPIALGAVLVGLARDPARRRALANAGHDWVRGESRFRWTNIAARHEEVYREAIADRRR